MRPNRDKVCHIRVNHLENHTKVAGYINAAAPYIVYDHRLLSQRSIALPEENAGEIFFPAFKSFSARPMSFSSQGVIRGAREMCNSLLRTNSARNVLTTVSKGSPSLAAIFSAFFLMFLSAFMLDAGFMY